MTTRRSQGRLPEDADDWISHSNEELIMRRCAYWDDLQGRDSIPGDEDSTTIHVPKQNLFARRAFGR